VRGDVYTRLWWENLSERDHLEDADLGGRVILRWKYRKCDGSSWTELIWLRIETLVNAAMTLGVPQNGGNFLTNLEPASFSRRTLFHVVNRK
jgi:hypothetical protein